MMIPVQRNFLELKDLKNLKTNSINENKLLGGDTEKNHDFIAVCHMTRRSKLGLDERVK